jgi:hypothetical protein
MPVEVIRMTDMNHPGGTFIPLLVGRQVTVMFSVCIGGHKSKTAPLFENRQLGAPTVKPLAVALTWFHPCPLCGS